MARVYCFSAQSWFIPFQTITCILTLLYRKNTAAVVISLFSQVLGMILFALVRLKGQVGWSMSFFVVNIVWPQLLIFCAYVILIGYYQKVCGVEYVFISKSESKLQAANIQLQMTSNAKSEFLSTIGHEIRFVTICD